MDFRGALHPNYCSYGSIISQPLIAEAEVEDSQAQAEKPAARGIDSLVKAAVPSRCSKKEIEFCFLASRFRRGKLRFRANQRLCSLG